MQSTPHTFKKEERLCSKKLLEKLFHNGSSFLLYPYSIVWLADTASAAGPYPVQVVISVSKKRFKKAADRNLVKRRIREIYRRYKATDLYADLQGNGLNLLLAIIYIGKELSTYSIMEKKLLMSFSKLKQQAVQNHVE